MSRSAPSLALSVDAAQLPHGHTCRCDLDEGVEAEHDQRNRSGSDAGRDGDDAFESFAGSLGVVQIGFAA